MNIFTSSLITVASAVARLLLLSVVGFFLVKMKIISKKGLDSISNIVIYFTLPAFIFTKFISNFSLSGIDLWWLFPAAGILINCLGLFLGYWVSFFMKEYRRREFGALLGLHNSGYLPLALVAALLSANGRATAYQYIFLIIMGTSLSMWTIGVHIISGSKKLGLKSLKNTLNPPFIAIIFSLILGFTHLNRFIPDFFINTLEMAGDITIPLIMIVLGGILASLRLTKNKYKIGISLLIFLKLLLFPAAGLLFIYLLRPPELIGLIIILQTASPPATNLVVIGSHFGKETDFLNQGLLYSYLFSITTLPIFISIFFTLYR